MSRTLPPLNAVRAFEAASRHLSFSRAAEELGVTQGAVSKHVISLEDFIGAQVFVRSPTGLSLTQEGYTLMEALRPAFAMMTDAFAHYHRRPPRSSTCRIATLASFAAQVLVPRLPEFRRMHPDIEIEFITSVRLVDLTREEADIGVRYGLGEYEGAVSGSGYWAILYARANTGPYREVARTPLRADFDEVIRVEWLRASAPEIADGFVRLVKNGGNRGAVRDLANDEWPVREVRLGVPSGSVGIPPGGSVRIDDYQASVPFIEQVAEE
jgi:DNA-binding transcriptional LysR family regulator